MVNNSVFSAVNMLIQTNRMHKKLINSSVSESIGLHRTQHIILMHIANREILPSQKELAEHLNITPAAVTGALKKLEVGGYIERRIGNDNRYNEITITPNGRKVVEESRAMFQRIDKTLFDGFADEDIIKFIEYLKKIQNNINKRVEVSFDEKMV